MVAVALLVAGCASQHERGEADPVPAPKENERREGSKAAAQSVPRYMLQHFAEFAGVERDLVAGNLESAKGHAANLVKARGGEPSEWQPYRTLLAKAAGAIGTSKTLLEAATHTAKVVLACAGCHADLGVTAKSRPSLVLPPSASVADKMRLHTMAIGALRTSILFGDDSLWKDGVALLNHAPLHPKEVVGPGTINPDLVERARSLRGCAKLAGQRSGPERVAIYGSLLATCVACHSPTPESARIHTCR